MSSRSWLIKAALIMVLLVLPFSSIACTENSPEGKLLRVGPAQQKKLAAIVKVSKKEYLKKYREEDRESVRDDRAELIRAWLGQNPEVKGWVGKLSKIGRTAEGNIILKINCGTFLIRNRVYLRNEAPEWPNTEISKNSSLYAEISKLNVGDYVRFDGVFICDSRACIVELSFIEDSAMIHPDFLMRFTRITKYGLPT